MWGSIQKASLGHPFWARRPSSPPPPPSPLLLPSESWVPPLLSDCEGPASPPAQAPSRSQAPQLVPPPQVHPGLQGPAAKLSVRSMFHPDPSWGSVLGPQGSSSRLGQASLRAQPQGPRPEPAAFAEPSPPTQASTPSRPPRMEGSQISLFNSTSGPPRSGLFPVAEVPGPGPQSRLSCSCTEQGDVTMEQRKRPEQQRRPGRGKQAVLGPRGFVRQGGPGRILTGNGLLIADAFIKAAPEFLAPISGDVVVTYVVQRDVAHCKADTHGRYPDTQPPLTRRNAGQGGGARGFAWWVLLQFSLCIIHVSL